MAYKEKRLKVKAKKRLKNETIYRQQRVKVIYQEALGYFITQHPLLKAKHVFSSSQRAFAFAQALFQALCLTLSERNKT
ncbi:MAG: hypothetical protein JXA77_09250 [Bacteroidales bacterium]|nr:hypothetical protein [Bacteroidales bacterium]MBN2818717.1 hypothetical protein [Bacteroidales bacterium]